MEVRVFSEERLRVPFLRCAENFILQEDMAMACFVVPAVEAVAVTIAAKVMKSKEADSAKPDGTVELGEKLSFSRKLKWLGNLLWGGSALLAFEHVWHGEVTPWFPFLTAAGNPASAAEMLREMSTAGVMMAAAVTAVWAGMVAVTSVMEKRAKARPAES